MTTDERTQTNIDTFITPAIEAMAGKPISGVGAGGVPLIYWGKYTAHDNNRDGIVLSQKLTQNIMAAFLQWKPVVVHDLHESVPFLYTSTGTGPYNDEYDPIVVDEWHTLAYQEITELTRRGLPGVWTHGFYDGWAPNYTLLAVANLHNSIGRFYETYTSRGADCATLAELTRLRTRQLEVDDRRPERQLRGPGRPRRTPAGLGLSTGRPAVGGGPHRRPQPAQRRRP